MSADRLHDQRPECAQRERGDADLICESATEAPPVSRRRSRRALRRLAAAGGTAALVAAVVAGVLLVVGTSRSPAAGGPSSARGAQAAATGQRGPTGRLAADAPCGLVTNDPHPAPAARVASFPAVAAVGCRSDYRSYPGDGVWQVMVRSVATRGLASLLAALRSPDEHGSSARLACPVAPVFAELPILLTDGHGRYLHPRVPTTACDTARPALAEALAALRWQPVSTSRVAPLRRPAAALRRCHTVPRVAVRSVQQPHLPNLQDQRLRACLLATPPIDGFAPLHRPGLVRPVVPPHRAPPR